MRKKGNRIATECAIIRGKIAKAASNGEKEVKHWISGPDLIDAVTGKLRGFDYDIEITGNRYLRIKVEEHAIN